MNNIFTLSFFILLFSPILIIGQEKEYKISENIKANHFPEQKCNDREYWIQVLTRIADPLLLSLNENKLKQKMPVECAPGREEYAREVTYLEAFGRLLSGIAPWLELGADETAEGKLRKKYINLAVKGLTNAVDPESSDFMNFNRHAQPLVDAAFFGACFVEGTQPIMGKSRSSGQKKSHYGAQINPCDQAVLQQLVAF